MRAKKKQKPKKTNAVLVIQMREKAAAKHAEQRCSVLCSLNPVGGVDPPSCMFPSRMTHTHLLHL